MKRTIITMFLVIGIFMTLVMSTGCTNKKYEFYGILDSDNATILPYTEITDEEIKADLEMFDGAYIQLKNDGTYEFLKILQSNKSDKVTHTRYGTYELDGKKLIFSTAKENGDIFKDTQQYIDGKIIYSDGVYMLVFI